MQGQVRAAFAVSGWEENTWDGQPASAVQGAKLTRVQAQFAYEGEMQGTSQVQYLMTYRADGTGEFLGYEQFQGTFAGKPGSFTTQHTGTFDPQAVKTHVSMVPRSGNGELAALHCEGDLLLQGHGRYPFTLDYRLP